MLRHPVVPNIHTLLDSIFIGSRFSSQSVSAFLTIPVDQASQHSFSLYLRKLITWIVITWGFTENPFYFPQIEKADLEDVAFSLRIHFTSICR